jgi:hypothetical protein
MYDNKIRLSPDVVEKAEAIASEWGLKNVRAAVEAVFRRYADQYLDGTSRVTLGGTPTMSEVWPSAMVHSISQRTSTCDALDELDDLLGL